MLFFALGHLSILLSPEPNPAEKRASYCVRGGSSYFQRPHVSKGHTLIVPRQHVSSIDQLSTADQKALWGFVGKVRERLLKDFVPDTFYIGFNNGAAAGQTAVHAHIHIIPCRQVDVPDPRGGIRWIVAEGA